MEALGLVERVENKATGAINYYRTEKSIRLEPVMNVLAEWAQCKIEPEIALGGADVSTVMWALRRMIDLAELPRRRAVIRFHFVRRCDRRRDEEKGSLQMEMVGPLPIPLLQAQQLGVALNSQLALPLVGSIGLLAEVFALLAHPISARFHARA